MSRTKIVIIYPYHGISKDSDNEAIFWKFMEISANHDIDNCPIVVVNKDTIENSKKSNEESEETSRIDIISTLEIIPREGKTFDTPNTGEFCIPSDIKFDRTECWSVDTCQMWLAGWGRALEIAPNAERIALLPGDIEKLDSPTEFWNELDTFLTYADNPFLIGDFKSKTRHSTKELIDTYGTYPLLANWFDTLSKAIHDLDLAKPRSEFLNLEIELLKRLIHERKFAYEQTINMLIHYFDFKAEEWPNKNIGPKVMRLGQIEDHKSLRDYRGALDQIERTERLIKARWRELNEPSSSGNYQKFIEDYDKLNEISASILASARVTIRSLLGK